MDKAIKLLRQYSPFGEIEEGALSDVREIFSSSAPKECTIPELIIFTKYFREELLKQPLPVYNSNGESAFREFGQYLKYRINDQYNRDDKLPIVKPLYDEFIETILKVYEEDCVTSGNYSSLRDLIYGSNFKTYAKENFTETHMKRLIQAFKREFEPKKETNVRSWTSNMPYPAGEILDMINPKVCESNKKEMIELLLFWCENSMKYKGDDDGTRNKIALVSKILSVFESPLKVSRKENNNRCMLFMDLDMKIYDYAFGKFREIMMSEDYGANRYVNDIISFLVKESLAIELEHTTNNELLAKAFAFCMDIRKNAKKDSKYLSKKMIEKMNERYLTIDFKAVGMKDHFDQFLDELASIRTREECSSLVELRKKHFEEKFFSIIQNDIEQLKRFLKVILENPWREVLNTFYVEKLEKKKLINFKKNAEIFSYIFDVAYNAKLDYDERILDCYWKIGLSLYEALDKQNCIAKFKKDIVKVIDKAFDFSKHHLHSAVFRMTYGIEWKNELATFHSILRKLNVIIARKEDLSHPSDRICETAKLVIERISYGVGKNKKILEIKDTLGELFNACYDLPWSIDDDDPRIAKKLIVNDDDKRTLAGHILKTSLKTIYQTNNDYSELLFPVIEVIKKLKRQDDDQELQNAATDLIKNLTDQMELLGDEGGIEIIDEFLEERNGALLGKVAEMYPNCSDYIHEKIPEILEITQEEENLAMHYFVQLMGKVIQHHPEQITEDIVDFLMTYLDGHLAASTFQIFQKIATTNSRLLEKHHTTIGDFIQNHEYGGMFCNLTADLSNSEQTASYFTDIIWKRHIATGETPYTPSLLYSFRSMAHKYKEPVAKYRQEFEKMREGKHKDAILAIFDVLDGRTLENVANDVEEQREDIDNLDSRVTNNEDKIENLDNDVRETKEDVANVKQDVKETKERIDQIEYTIKGLDERVEELSHMTLSHAPAWTRHVSELMNDQTDHDWRLLAMKLNYTNDDIRNWATQPDPCLSMFDEWFATHKTREATNAILTNLKEMNRLDAAEIVESALANVKDVVQDDEDEEFEKPEVFLSYQWGHQQEVKLLRKHLEMAGFKAWMDIGQMGGGDKLYAKIDDGVRSAKVIISCVSEKYAKSANCCREVNLSTNLGKPMIPILMEQLSWPPAGPMGPIMSEYLYIRFFKSGGMEKGDSVFWLPAKFQELLMQVRYFVVPDMKLITNDSPYKGWMNPPEEEIIIPKREQKAIESSNGKSEENTEQEVSPDVFISYQWGKQPQIKRLYKKLSEMGYYCWLDIMQMGGGDSLFDKIDKGIRGAKVIISCVTPKYALSANCRREVSLSGALSKPIVPLLLEDMKWPPEGPMSMTFTELLYIGFHRKKDDKLWEGDEFNQLISKIDLNAPGCRMISEAAETNESNKKAKDDEEAARKRKLEEENKQKELEKENAKRIEEERRKEAEEMKKLAEEKRKQEEEIRMREEEIRKREEAIMKRELELKKVEEDNRRKNEEKQRRETELRRRNEEENRDNPPKKSSTCSIL
ncbi:DgyrCDS8670 [Dimorphilus gyrociliatus]|uniref:DgyrCDS8670 n=1 Tax=Dimorphilus gyrociliatus TaxID=2664684 RepID=A0A7I8VWA7_9ANNE|nr:DgyrCDS8670 [Dimorphilus gyrociliatus]